MKRLLIAAAAVVFGTSSLFAADMAVKAPVYKAVPSVGYNWSGWYTGISLGGHETRDRDPAVLNNTPGWFGGVDPVTATNAFPVSMNKGGFAGGGQVGYNWQMSTFVLGLEADIMGLSGTASRAITFPLNGGQQTSFITDSARNRWMATLRGKLGLAVDRVMIYGTGGLAIADGSVQHTYSDTAGMPLRMDNTSQTRTGWVAGGGIEYAVMDNWSVRGEYLHADFGKTSNILQALAPGGGGFSVQHVDHVTEDVGRFSINYKFGGPVVAKY